MMKAIEKEAPLSAYITNLGKYNEGELAGKWVDFPTTPKIMADTFKEIGIDGKRYEEYFITDYNDNIGCLYDILGEYENLSELNYLAAQLNSLDSYDLEKLTAIIQCGDGISCAADVINMTKGNNMDAYDFLPDINNDEDLGYYWIEESGIYNLKDMGNLVNYIDYEKFGRDIRLDEGGFYVDPRGYMRNNGDSIEVLYSDINDVIDKYKL